LLPIIGHHSGNQPNTIISSTLYTQEFFNRIGQKQPLDGVEISLVSDDIRLSLLGDLN